MEQVEVSNKYIDMGVNNGSEKWTGKNTATYDRLIKAVYVSHVYVCMLCTGMPGQLECNSVFSGLGSDLSVGRMVRWEGAWVFCLYISYTGGEGQLGCNFLEVIPKQVSNAYRMNGGIAPLILHRSTRYRRVKIAVIMTECDPITSKRKQHLEHRR